MKIREVRIKNFRGFGENPNDNENYYRFRNIDEYKLIIFNGYNGYGKTSFFDAIEWCLTNTISRIHDKETVLYKKNLKASHYLKFVNEKDDSKRKRIIEIVIIFDDGTFIKRTTNSWSLHENSYLKNTHLVDEKGVNLDEQALWAKLINNNQVDPNEFIGINFLGQENMNSFLRSKNPIERTKSLMQLIGQAKLSEIVELSKKDNFKKLTTHINDIDTNMCNLADAEKKLSKLFSINNWGEIDQFLFKIKESINNLLRAEGGMQFKDIWGISSIFDEDIKIDSDNLTHILDLCNVKYIKLNADGEEYKKKYDFLLESWFLDKLTIRYKKIQGIGYLQDRDLKQLNDANQQYSQAQSMYENSLNSLKQFSISIEPYKDLWRNIKSDIDIKKYTIKENFWVEQTNLISKFGQFISKSKDYDTYIQDKDLLTGKLDIMYWKLKKTKYDKFVKVLKILLEKIESIEDTVKELSNLNNKYKEVLLSVAEYISDQESVNECPICLNKDFSRLPDDILSKQENNLTTKDTLLSIISFTIMNGNDFIEKLNKKIVYKRSKYNKLLSSLSKDILQSILADLEIIIQGYNKLYLFVENAVIDQTKCIENHVNYYKNKQGSIADDINQYRKVLSRFFSNILYQDGEQDQLINRLTVKRNILENQIDRLREYLNSRITPSYLLNQENILEKYKEHINKIQSISEEDRSIKTVKIKIKELNELIKMFDDLKKYTNITDEDKQHLLTYYKNQKYKEQLKVLKNEFRLMKLDQEQLERNSEIVQNKTINEMLRKNIMVQWVYSKINPHPFFRELEFDYDKSEGTNIKYGELSELYLDHIFSSAQLNVLALSIFLGLGLTQRCTNLDQVFLDDPIQSMDDINILSYIDLMRAIFDSKIVGKNIIISTHDDNFTKLLSIKMRNKKFMIYNFISYGDEGPIISYEL